MGYDVDDQRRNDMPLRCNVCNKFRSLEKVDLVDVDVDLFEEGSSETTVRATLSALCPECDEPMGEVLIDTIVDIGDVDETDFWLLSDYDVEPRIVGREVVVGGTIDVELKGEKRQVQFEFEAFGWSDFDPI
jgi:hypothetical protein